MECVSFLANIPKFFLSGFDCVLGALEFALGLGLGSRIFQSVQLLGRLFDPLIEFGKALMIEGFEDREALFASPDDRFLDIAKECSEAVEVLHGDRVVFVVMALRAGDGLTEPDRADGPNAIG